MCWNRRFNGYEQSTKRSRLVSVALPLQARSPPPPAMAITPCMVSTVGLCLPLQNQACLHTPSLMYRVRSHRGRIHGALLQHRKDTEPKTGKSFSRWTLLHALHCLFVFSTLFFFFSFLFPPLCIAFLVLVAQFVFFIPVPIGTTIGSGEFWTEGRLAELSDAW